MENLTLQEFIEQHKTFVNAKGDPKIGMFGAEVVTVTALLEFMKANAVPQEGIAVISFPIQESP